MDEFDRIKVIGKGSYGEVWLSKHKKDQKMIAFKVIAIQDVLEYVLKRINLQRASKKERSSAEQEASLLQKLKHPNIVSYKQSFETPSGLLYIAMQYCEGGDLYTKLKEQKGVLLEERQVVEWFVQITMALQYMHERNILHRDLKTQNIFLTKSKIIKLGDLGIARVLDAATDMATTLIGTPYYMSPEIFSNKPYNHKSDVWALGCCLYEMTTLKHAFNARDMNSLVYKILKGRLPPMPRQYSPDLLDLLRAMLHQDPLKRPTINRILREPYIRQNIAIFLEETRRGASRRSSVSGKRPSSARSSGLPSSARTSASGIRKSSNSAESERPVSSSVSSRNDAVHVMGQNKPDAEASRNSPALRNKKPPTPTPKDLAPITEVASTQGKGDHDSESDKEGTLKANAGKEEPEEESKAEEVKRKKKKKLIPNRQSVGSHSSGEKDSGQSDAVSARSDNGAAVRNVERPLSAKASAVPTAEKSEGLPQKHQSLAEQRRSEKGEKDLPDSGASKSSSLSDGVLDDTPRQSLPNMSARDRRRKEKASSSMENPLSARNIKLRKVPERAESERVTKKENMSTPNLKALQPRRQRQPSLRDSSSSSDECLPALDENTKERQKRRENKEMNNFISMLDITLKRNMEGEKSDEEDTLEAPGSPSKPAREQQPQMQRRRSEEVLKSLAQQKSPSREVAPVVHKSASMPSVETLTSTSRLMDRIRLLHKDCVQGVGYADLKKAYDILDHIDEDEVEPKLMALLGKEKFDEYAGKIWQLKFCEEAFLMS